MTDGVGKEYRSHHRRFFVQDAGALEAWIPELEAADAIGVDLEMGQRVDRLPGGVQQWKHVLALVQIATDDLSLIVDPLRCPDLSPLGPLMSGPVRKVFLGGGQDVALLDQAGIPARTIIDVGEVAFGLWGRREDGMAALSRRMFGLSLDKTVRRADWLVRPLNHGLLAYAYQDAELTLAIYRWFSTNFPVELQYHERLFLDPPLPEGTPPWLQAVMRRTPSDALVVVSEFGMRPDDDQDQMVGAAAELLAHPLPPRQLGRLVRIIGEFALAPLAPSVASLSAAPTAVIRGAVARSLGLIGRPDRDVDVLDRLREDPVEDVRKAAETAAKELRKPKQEAKPQPVEVDPVSLNDDALQALESLMRRLEANEGGS